MIVQIFHLGDSSNILISLLPQVDNPAILFLDGHWSSGDTGRDDKDCPLIEEIKAINDNFKYEAVIIIDDCRLFGKGPRDKTCNEDWSGINKNTILIPILGRINKLYSLESNLHPEDRLVIHINKL